MLFKLLKIPAWFCLQLYCRYLLVKPNELLKIRGPLLIACNHPNSFLDAIVLASIFKQPIYSLARGDAFKNKFVAAALRSLNMLPVYRTSEGVENLEHNYNTFSACKEIFKQAGIVLIFSEGHCVNEWHLRPLKKGTARLALSSWEDGIDVKVLPAGINYSSFKNFGKEIHLHFGQCFGPQDVERHNGFGRSVASFNNLLQEKLQPLVYEIDAGDEEKRKRYFAHAPSHLKRWLLIVPATLAFVFHAPVYSIAKSLAKKFGGHNDHYDSILVAVLFALYPWYLLLLCMLLFLLHVPFWWLGFILLPLLALAFLHFKKG